MNSSTEIKYTIKQPVIEQPIINSKSNSNLETLSLSISKNLKTPIKTLHESLIQKGINDSNFMAVCDIYAQMSLQIFSNISNETAATIGMLRASKAYYGITYQQDIEDILRYIDNRY